MSEAGLGAEPERVLRCITCWVEVIPMPENIGGRTIGRGEPTTPQFVHKSPRDERGNPNCGKQFLEEGDVDSDVEAVEEA